MMRISQKPCKVSIVAGMIRFEHDGTTIMFEPANARLAGQRFLDLSADLLARHKKGSAAYQYLKSTGDKLIRSATAVAAKHPAPTLAGTIAA